MDLIFNKSTDTEHEIELESHLISASWITRKAIAGRTVVFEVVTSFVGEGAKIKIKGKSENGLNLGKIKGKIKKNVYGGEFEIPADAELGDRVYFEVKLPQNDLEGESDRIPVFPPVRVFNLSWSAPEARRGDVLTLSADTSGMRDHTEVTLIIYEHDTDSAHDKIIELPAKVMDDRIEVRWEYEYHEDTDEIATQEELDRYGSQYNPPEYFFTVKVEITEFGREQESGLLEFKDYVEFTALDESGEPMKNRDYILKFADGSERNGKLDDNGYVKITDLPPGAVEIEFPADESRTQGNEPQSEA